MTASGAGVVIGADGLARCAWGAATPDYLEYHDTEWGVPVRGERALFERLTLEAFQSGLSWLTILRKRRAFRDAFRDFDPDAVAAFGPAQAAALMGDAGIVRNRRKIDAAVTNARAVVALREQGGLDRLVWAHAPTSHHPPRTPADLRATTAESVALAAALRTHGFVHLGPTTAYATMQACGLVNDHLAACHRCSR